VFLGIWLHLYRHLDVRMASMLSLPMFEFTSLIIFDMLAIPFRYQLWSFLYLYIPSICAHSSGCQITMMMSPYLGHSSVPLIINQDVLFDVCSSLGLSMMQLQHEQ
jgi:hypothetical protein